MTHPRGTRSRRGSLAHLAVAACCVATGAGIARADELTATLGEPLHEVSHTVDIQLADGVAIYRVRRQFANPGVRADEASLAIDLPAGAAATGLRIKARDRWYDGELMEAARAAALYHELTGLGAWKPKDPALLQWEWADKLHLQVFPVLPGQVSTVEYTLTVPTRYTGGRYWVSYPRVATGANANPDSRPLVAPLVSVRTAWPITGDKSIVIDGVPAAPRAQRALSPPVHQAWEDQVGAEPSASYVASTLEVPASSHTRGPITQLTLALELSHTYNSDLKVQLITPQGAIVVLHDRQGGDKNGLHGTRTVALPAGTTGAGTWRLVASDHVALDTGAIDRWSIAFGHGSDATQQAATDTPVFIPDAPESANDAGVATIAVTPPAIATWTARFGRVIASGSHAFARLEVDVAPVLTPLPRRAQVVFIVDASYSVGEDHLAAQLDVIRAYLSHVADAEVEIVVTRRHATRVFAAFVPVKTALATLGDPRVFALGNGSALDEAARLATTALADRSGPRRVVVLTDELLRDALTPDRAIAGFAGLSPDTVVHLVVPSVDHDDRVAMTPAEADPYAPIATRHHGIDVELHGLPAVAKLLAPTVLELVRPTKIEHLTVAGIATDVTTLHEGDGLRAFEGVATAPGELTLRGQLWSDPIVQHLAPLLGFSKQTAAFVFGADEYHELSNDEMMAVALQGAAVSPVTSYVAAEPGTRPSTIGLERGGFGTIGHGMMGGMGYGSGTGTGGLRPDPAALIDPEPCVQRVRPADGWRVAFTIETTRDEVVDVTGVASDPLAACLAEAAWGIRLDLARFSSDRDAFPVVFQHAPAVRGKRTR